MCKVNKMRDELLCNMQQLRYGMREVYPDERPCFEEHTERDGEAG